MKSFVNRLRMASLAIVLYGICANALGESQGLPRIAQLDISRITVSGLSSGAAMAVQLGVAYSSRVGGVGIIAGPPYLCAEGSVWIAFNTCLLLGGAQLDKWTGNASGAGTCEPKEGKALDVANLIDDTLALARRGAIDPVAGISTQKVWEFRGRCDTVVGSNASAAQAVYYRHFGADFQSRTQADTSHTLPTDKLDQGACNAEDKDYVSSCNFDAVGAMLRHILPAASAHRAAVKGGWLRFDQARYVAGRESADKRLKAISMAREGQVFVPEMCATKPCRLHIALHGCLQGIDDAVFDNYVHESGYAEWASSLGLVVLFPRATALKAFERLFDAVGNPAGCWDWWGYTNSGVGSFRRYATHEAPQMLAIMKMAGSLAGQ